MQFPRLLQSFGVLGAASIGAALVVALSPGLLTCFVPPAVAAPTNLAYDEITKFVRADQPTPEPGTFTADFQAAQDAAQKAANEQQHHGLFGGIMNAVSAMKNVANMFTTGIAERRYYMNGWDRTDDIATQTATIHRPDRHEIIYLNIAKKTYHVVDTNAQTVTETPPPYQNPQPTGQMPSPQPGTGKLDISESSTALGPKTIENVATTGYSQDFKLTSTQSTGSCKDGSFETAMVEYISNYAEPQAGIVMKASTPHKMNMPAPAMMGVKPGCTPTTTFHHSGGATVPNGRLALWTLVTLKASAQTNQGQAGGGFSTLTERGNVRTLGSSDASLFDIPSDYTKEQ
jgi:hypothetical protein